MLSRSRRHALSAPALFAGLLAASFLAACSGAGPPRSGPGPDRADVPAPADETEAAAAAGVGPGTAAGRERPRPYPVVPPPRYRRAVEGGTRSPTGAPGPRYWQQWTDYRLRAALRPEEGRVDGEARIVYHNASPDTLQRLYLRLVQNVHAEGAARNERAEVTGGMELFRLAVGGHELEADPERGEPGYRIRGTILEVTPPEALPPGGEVELSAGWSFRVPERGAGGRMGRDEGLFFLAYWYPWVAVYDDVVGWHTDPFLGSAEFYAGFGSYELEVEAPAGWLVRATGRLQNPEEVLPEEVLARLRAAEGSDTVVRVLGTEDFGPGTATRGSPGDRLVWRFRADTARDAAFSATRASRWDAARTSVGDRDGDGREDFARVEAVWRPAAEPWAETARYARHAIAFHSRFTGLPYPWPHMTAVEGGGIIGGGMEFPMMTLMGDYVARGDSALYYVTAHELAHMWVPMIVGTDETRYGWMDEGMTSFLENQARKSYFPGNPSDSLERARYLEVARAGLEGPMMRWTDYHYPGPASGTASYSKPATLLAALRGLLGEGAFTEAYRTFHAEWAFRHPKPWDFFRTFERVAGRDLGWFWRSWYYETWTLDHAVRDVVTAADGVRIVVEDRGLAPMPARLRIVRRDGETLRREIPVERWLAGAREVTVTLPPGPPVVRVELDPEGVLPDIDRTNDTWTAAGSEQDAGGS